MKLAFVLVAAALVLAVHASDRTVLFTRHPIGGFPVPWRPTGRAPPSSYMRIHVALPHNPAGVAALEAAVLEIADIESARYGKFMTAEEATAYVAPPAAVRERVVAWLVGAGVAPGAISGAADVVTFDAPISVVEAVFATTVVTAEHDELGWTAAIAVGEWSVPTEIVRDVAMVVGLSDFPAERPSATKGAAAAGYDLAVEADDDEGSNPYSESSAYSHSELGGNQFWPQRGRTVPAILEMLYNVSTYKASPKVSIAAVEFQGVDCFSYTDIEAYQKLTGVPFHNITHIIDARGFQPSNCQGESTLDVEQILGLAGGATQMYFGGQGWIYSWAIAYQGLAAADSPQIVSLSYGWPEEGQLNQCQIAASECSSLGVNSTGYVVRSNTELAKLAGMGKSMFICTQDEGAPSDTNAEGTNTEVPVTPIFPASSPWVTAVGATVLIDKYPAPSEEEEGDNPWSHIPVCAKMHCSRGTEEQVAMAPTSAFTSGGMFSNVAPLQSWQADTVKAYLASAKVKPDAKYFNANGRAYPDISANGVAVFFVGSYGQPGPKVNSEGGTSASTPATAALFAIVSSQMVERGYPPIGFVTPTLYTMGKECPQCFNAITTGANYCTGWGREMPCITKPTPAGFSAQAGWNAAVGFGTPNVGNIVEYMIAKHEARVAKYGA